MKKFYLLLALLLTCFMGGQAQTGGKTVLLYGLRDYSVFALSPNGQWATGAFTNGLGSYYAFSWNLVTGDCVLLSGGNNQSVGYGVSNDGTVVGTYSSSEVSENGAVVECAAYCTPDGTWHILGGANGGYAVGGQALCVSGNGEYIGGAMTISGRWSPVVWKNGEFHKNLCIMEGGSLQQGAVFSISGDGSVAGGWTYTSTSGGERESVYWDVENWNEETADAYTMLTFDGNPFYAVRGISPDGNYLVYMSAGGVTYVRNIETGEDTRVPGLEGVEMWELNYNAINDQRMAVGSESIGNGGSYIRAVVTYVDENGDMVTRPIDDYVREQDPEVDFASVGIAENPGIKGAYQLLEGRGVSNDGNVFAVVTADTGSSERPLVILMNRGGVQAPVAGEAEQLDGLYATKLTWYAPLGSEDEITGYNIYRNGEKVNAAAVTELSYIDANLSEGSYNYSVTALYGDTESEASSEVAIALTPKPVSVPNAVYLRQKGLNSAALSWTTPSTNRVEKNYLDPNVAIDAFGGGNRSFEGGIKFDHNEIAVYEGYTLTAVAFYPMSEQQRWTLNIYDGTELVYTQPIEQSLTYGEENIVTLNEPFDLSTLENDIICAISVTVPTGVETYNVLGVNLDKQVIPGYSDLMRSSTEAAEGTFLYSMYDYSVGNGTSTRVSWGISMIFSAPDEAADIDELSQYNIFMNGEQVGQTENLTYVESGLEDGTYTFGVQAQYADGRTSEIVSSDIAIEENKRDAIKALTEAASGYDDVEITALKTKYPQGGEKQLIDATLNRQIPSGGLPASVGVVVQNVATAYAVWNAVVNDIPLTERIVTVTGPNVSQPGNYMVPIGTPLSAVIEAAGGIPDNTAKVILGGPMMGKAASNLNAPTTKGVSGILILPNTMSKREEPENCVRCASCVSVCPMGLEPYLLARLSELKNYERLEQEHVMDCIECGSCSFICISHRPILDYIRIGKMRTGAIIKSRKSDNNKK